MKNWFLYRVYRFNRMIFYLMMFFLGGTIITNLLGWQIMPFFIWGMYSEKEVMEDDYSVFRITVNGTTTIDYTAGYSNATRFFLSSPLELYLSMKNNGGTDPTETFLKKKLKQNFSLVEKVSSKVFNGKTEYEMFLPWYKRYLEQTLKIPVNNFTIDILKGKYITPKSFQMYSTALIDSWKH